MPIAPDMESIKRVVSAMNRQIAAILKGRPFNGADRIDIKAVRMEADKVSLDLKNGG